MPNRFSRPFSAPVSLALLVLAFLTLASGCGSGEPPAVYEPQKMIGEVDSTAAPGVQAQQQALIRLFDEMMQGTGPKFRSRDVVLSETDEEFFEGSAYLSSWDWNGPAAGDDFPVKIVLLDGDEQNETEVERIYTITAGRPFTVTRKP